jgi:hypothetical protein
VSLFKDSVIQTSQMLANLDGLLVKAVAFAEAKDMSPDEFLRFRLAPDMRALDFQVQAACDAAKFAAARLADVDPPAHPDEESTMGQLRERVAKVRAYLEGFEEAQFEGAEDRKVRMSFLPGKWIRGEDYLREMALPNFYFHVTTAYALLRSAGVNIGKRDYITTLTLHDDA